MKQQDFCCPNCKSYSVNLHLNVEGNLTLYSSKNGLELETELISERMNGYKSLESQFFANEEHVPIMKFSSIDGKARLDLFRYIGSHIEATIFCRKCGQVSIINPEMLGLIERCINGNEADCSLCSDDH